VADWFAAQADVVARFAGGDNAGHTVRVGDETYKLHLVPSGVLYPDVICMLGAGMVINPVKLTEELRGLADRGIDISPDRIKIAERAHLITPAHIALDGAKEAQRGEGAIGTTRRGIGPAYTDKAARVGIRAGAMKQPDQFVEQVEARIGIANQTLAGIDGAEPVDAAATASELHDAAEFLAPYLADVPLLVHRALEDDKYVVAEGAQGTLLDIDHGNYPFVTSSSPTAGGAMTGLGIGPKHVTQVTGITKAYCTRVGAGPFPTELHDENGDRLRGTGANPWDEFGTTTGRPRRCGWLDLVVLRYAARINGLTDLIITKLDILSGFDSLSVATGYSLDGETITEMSTEQESFARCEPVYESVGGWQDDVMGVDTFEALPGAAQDYVGYIEDRIGLPVKLITVGPARAQTIMR
jgi:adenylosuccinate synthase